MIDNDSWIELQKHWTDAVGRISSTRPLSPSTRLVDERVTFQLNGFDILHVEPLQQSQGYRVEINNFETGSSDISHAKHPDIAGTVKHVLGQFLVNDIAIFLKATGP